jgi:hypothetical protein
MGRRIAALTVTLGCAVAGLLGFVTAPASAALSGSPVGSFAEPSARFDDISILSGNAYDPDAGNDPLTVRFYVGATFVGATTTVPAPGGSTPFEWSIASNQLTGPPSYDATVCAYGINVGPGTNALLGCRRIRPEGGSDRNPHGSLDAAIASPGLVQLKGWAGDPDGDRTTQLRIYYDGKLVAEKTASLPRPDVQRTLPAVGPTTGFNVALPIAPGGHQICVYAQNTGPAGSANGTVGCVSRSVRGMRPAGPHDPRGSYDDIGSGPGSVFPDTVHSADGWAYDPDTAGPVTVRIRTLMYRYFVAGPFLHQNKTLTTGLARPDVAAAVPGAGPSAGFRGVVASGSFSYVRISCAYVENVGLGVDRFIGCASENAPSVVRQF